MNEDETADEWRPNRDMLQGCTFYSHKYGGSHKSAVPLLITYVKQQPVTSNLVQDIGDAASYQAGRFESIHVISYFGGSKLILCPWSLYQGLDGTQLFCCCFIVNKIKSANRHVLCVVTVPTIHSTNHIVVSFSLYLTKRNRTSGKFIIRRIIIMLVSSKGFAQQQFSGFHSYLSGV